LAAHLSAFVAGFSGFLTFFLYNKNHQNTNSSTHFQKLSLSDTIDAQAPRSRAVAELLTQKTDAQ
jgi:hypothetical protein